MGCGVSSPQASHPDATRLFGSTQGAVKHAGAPTVPVSFGRCRFRGATAAPFLAAHGLPASVLDTSAWTKQHSDAVAAAVCAWAFSLGAIHVCHWTQPLRSANATWRASEPTRMVHALFNPDASGSPVPILDGEYLLFGEGDSRKMIDPTSPMWVRGDTLFIPCVFANYYNSFGEHDPVVCEKTPLHRSMQAVSQAGVALMRALGHTCESVLPNIGLEQEFYLVARAAYERRPDLQLCGRTLIGVEPDGGDLYDTHSAPPNAAAGACMAQVQRECYDLGIALRTRHRESGPNQYEFAPHFGIATAQIDENLIVMEVVEDVARAHGLVALFHEKPFAGVSGSGKHNNFSLSTDGGFNLFHEGHMNALDQAKADYATFPTILAAVCRAVHKHGDLFLAGVAVPGNDFRMTRAGAAEAPPLTISTHLGEALTKHLELFARAPENATDAPMPPFHRPRAQLTLGIEMFDQHGGIAVSAEPRNRTAPFPYGGRRFELRAPGGSQNTSMANVAICSAIAEAFNEFASAINGGVSARAVAAASLRAHGLKAVFNGDNYSHQWREEAHGRGLYSATSIVEAMSRIEVPKAVSLFGPLGVLSAEELETRAALYYENYYITVTVEARCLLDLLTQRLLPAASACGLTSTAKPDASALARLEASVPKLKAALADLEEEDDADTLQMANLCSALRLGLMEEIRGMCNELEALMPASCWPLASYKELLFDDMAYAHQTPSPPMMAQQPMARPAGMSLTGPPVILGSAASSVGSSPFTSPIPSRPPIPSRHVFPGVIG